MDSDQHLSVFSQICFFFLAILAISGCGDDSGGGDKIDPVQNITFSTYTEKPGDVFSYTEIMDITYSNGQNETISESAIESYSQVDAIPSKYFYFGDINGPYILNTQTENSETDGYEYCSLSGTEIVDDDLDTFTRIDATTTSGSDEPVGFISSGDSFDFSESCILFDSDTGVEVGNENYQGTLTVEGTQTISVPAGSFESLKINSDIDYIYTKRGITNSASFNASFWYSVENGFMIKISGTMSMTLNEYNLTAEASIDNELCAYEVGINSIGNSFLKQQTNFYPSIASAINKRIDKNQHIIRLNK